MRLAFKSEKDTLETTMKDERSEAKRLQAEQKSRMRDLEERITSMKSHIAVIEGDKKLSVTQLEKSEVELEALKHQIKVLVSETAKAKQNHSQELQKHSQISGLLRKGSQEVKLQLEQSQNKNRELQVKFDNATDKIKLLEGKMESYRSKYETGLQNMRQKIQEMEQLTEETKEEPRRILELEDQLAILEAKNSETSTKLKELQIERKSLLESQTEIQRSNESLCSQVTEERDRNSSIASNLRSLVKENEELKSTIRNLKLEVTKLLMGRDEIKKASEKTNQEVNELNQLLDEKQKKIEEIKGNKILDCEKIKSLQAEMKKQAEYIRQCDTRNRQLEREGHEVNMQSLKLKVGLEEAELKTTKYQERILQLSTSEIETYSRIENIFGQATIKSLNMETATVDCDTFRSLATTARKHILRICTTAKTKTDELNKALETSKSEHSFIMAQLKDLQHHASRLEEQLHVFEDAISRADVSHKMKDSESKKLYNETIEQRKENFKLRERMNSLQQSENRLMMISEDHDVVLRRHKDNSKLIKKLVEDSIRQGKEYETQRQKYETSRQSQIARIESLNDALRERVRELECLRVDTKEQVFERDSRIHELAADVANLKLEIKLKKRKITEVSALHGRLKLQAQEMKNKLERQVEENAQLRQRSEASSLENLHKMNESFVKVKVTEDENATLKKKVLFLLQQQNREQMRTEDVYSLCHAYRLTIVEKDEEIFQFKRQIQNLTDEIVNSEEKCYELIDQHEGTLIQEKEKVGKLKQQNDLLSDWVEDLNRQKDLLTKQIDEYSEETDRLQQTLKTSLFQTENEIKSFKTEMLLLEGKYTELQQQCSSKDRSLKVKRRNLLAARDEIESLTSRLRVHEENLGTFEANNKKLEAEKLHLQMDRDKLEEKLLFAVTEPKKLRSNLTAELNIFDNNLNDITMRIQDSISSTTTKLTSFSRRLTTTLSLHFKQAQERQERALKTLLKKNQENLLRKLRKKETRMKAAAKRQRIELKGRLEEVQRSQNLLLQKAKQESQISKSNVPDLKPGKHEDFLRKVLKRVQNERSGNLKNVHNVPVPNDTSFRSNMRLKILNASLNGDAAELEIIMNSKSFRIAKVFSDADDSDFLPLHRAVSGYHFHNNEENVVQCVKLLLQHGANAKAKDRAGNSVSQKATQVMGTAAALGVINLVREHGV